jgi:prophage regulatory protein
MTTMRILRRPETRTKTGLCDATIDQKEARGEFPQRVRLGTGRAIGWLEHEIDAWISDRVVERNERREAGTQSAIGPEGQHVNE